MSCSKYCLYLFALFFLFSCVAPEGKTIIVSSGKSINDAIQQCEEGDTILIHGGVYREVLNIDKSDICIQGFSNEKVIITGTQEVRNWTEIGKNYYKAYCKKEVLQLFEKNRMLLPARWPNYDSSMYSTRNWKKLYTSNDSTFFVDNSWPENYWNGAWCYAIAGKKWVVNVEQVLSSKDSILKMKDFWFNYQNKNWYTGDADGFILKHINALDTLDEWHWQNDTLFAMLENKPDSINAQIIDIVIKSKGQRNVVMQNICIVGGRIQLENVDNFEFNQVNVINGTAPKIYEYSNGAAYAAIEFLGESQNCSISNSIVDGNWGGGIYLEGENNSIFNCVVSNCNWMGNGTANIGNKGYGHAISFCDVFNSGKFLIVHNNTQRLSIKNNHLHDGGYLANDLGLTYTYGTDGDNTEIAYNMVHGNHSKEAGVGIYLDIECKKFLVHHNVVYDCLSGIQTIMNAYDHEIYNNTIWNCGKAINYWGEDGSNMYNQKVYNNLANDIFDAGTDVRFNLSTGINQFEDSLHHNFKLAKGAKAIDCGTIIPEITNEFTGENPDAGAFEFGLPAWKYGCDKSLLNKDYKLY
jgi:parallel beta-helix repeat protein